MSCANGSLRRRDTVVRSTYYFRMYNTTIEKLKICPIALWFNFWCAILQNLIMDYLSVTNIPLCIYFWSLVKMCRFLFFQLESLLPLLSTRIAALYSIRRLIRHHWVAMGWHCVFLVLHESDKENTNNIEIYHK